MPNYADRPVKKVTVYLYETDCQYLRMRFGDWGWGREVREITHKWVRQDGLRRSNEYGPDGTFEEQAEIDRILPERERDD